MMKSGFTRHGVSALAAAIAVLAVPVGAAAADIAVYRGATAGAAALHAVETRFGVTEIRGRLPAESPILTAETPIAQPLTVAAGSRLWLYDPETKAVTVCRLDSFGWAGRRSLVCEKAATGL